MGVPDLTASQATTNATDTVSVFTRPNAYGQPLHTCYTIGGNTTDATITLTLRDVDGAPIAHYPAEDLYLATSQGGLVLCPRGSMADQDTDANGITTFSRPLSGGGYSDAGGGEGTQVFVNGEPLTQPPLDILFNGADINRDLRVDVVDVWNLANDFNGPYHYRSDFYWDNQLDLRDVTLFALSFSQECGNDSGYPYEAALQIPMPAATMGIYFDPEGTQLSTFVAPFQPFEAYIVLRPESDTTVASASWRIVLPAGIFTFSGHGCTAIRITGLSATI